VRELLEKNIDNEEFNINDVCREMAVGHTQLYRKFKSISNLTIADYFKLLRLNKAKELLSDSEMNITQIAFAVGFKNLSHFSREFAIQFGKSPKEVRKEVI
jgi:transcriptional regulator GlxA family with amidase domain